MTKAALMLMAVREKMGDEAFFQALRSLEARQIWKA